MDFTPCFASMHLHSPHSDGQFSPRQLVILAKSLGYGGIVLIDHDVLSGIPAAAPLLMGKNEIVFSRE